MKNNLLPDFEKFKEWRDAILKNINRGLRQPKLKTRTLFTYAKMITRLAVVEAEYLDAFAEGRGNVDVVNIPFDEVKSLTVDEEGNVIFMN